MTILEQLILIIWGLMGLALLIGILMYHHRELGEN
jgi:hypothetical protein